MDHYGDDLKRVSADNYIECGEKCIQHNLCKRWTFKPFTAFPESKNRNMSLGMCILNHGQNYFLNKCGNCVSGFKTSKSRVDCRMNGKCPKFIIIENIRRVSDSIKNLIN